MAKRLFLAIYAYVIYLSDPIWVTAKVLLTYIRIYTLVILSTKLTHDKHPFKIRTVLEVMRKLHMTSFTVEGGKEKVIDSDGSDEYQLKLVVAVAAHLSSTTGIVFLDDDKARYSLQEAQNKNKLPKSLVIIRVPYYRNLGIKFLQKTSEAN